MTRGYTTPRLGTPPPSKFFYRITAAATANHSPGKSGERIGTDHTLESYQPLPQYQAASVPSRAPPQKRSRNRSYQRELTNNADLPISILLVSVLPSDAFLILPVQS
jgi:hypothetical protein